MPSPSMRVERPRTNGPPSTRETTSATPEKSSNTRKFTVSGPRFQPESAGTGVISGGVVSGGVRPTFNEQKALPRRRPLFMLRVRTTPRSTVRDPRTHR